MTLAPPFTVLYLRPEIGSGFYSFPTALTSPAQGHEDPSSSSEDPSNTSDAPTSSTPLLPGVPPDEAAFFFPDGQIVAVVRRRVQRSGFTILQERVVEFTKPQLRRLYFSGLRAEDDEATRTAFLDRFTRGPTLALLLSLHETDADAAVTTLHALLGPENPTLARQQALGAGLPVDAWPLRALFGLNADFPGVYGSATLDCALRERHALFSDGAPRALESAVVALFAPLLAAVPDAKAQLHAAFARHGLVVTTASDIPALSAEQINVIETAKLHQVPALRSDERDAVRAQLEGVAAQGATTVLRVVGFDVDATLRALIGPASGRDAARFFPESLRAQAALAAPVKTTEPRPHVAATCLDSGMFFSLHAAAIQALAPENEQVTQTFAIIKPNAARDPATVREIQDAIRAFGFSIDRQRRLRLSAAQATAFYAEHTGKPFFARLTAFMTSGEIVAMQLSRKLAIPMWRALMGPTNALVARETAPWTLRARFGVDGTQNATHGSDALASARRELRFFFGETPWNAPVDAQSVQVVQVAQATGRGGGETLERVVVRGLDALLAAATPAGAPRRGPLDACRWLGEWLLREAESATDSNNNTTPAKATKTTGGGKVHRTRPAAAAATSPEKGDGNDDDDNRRVIAIALDASVAAATRESLERLVREHVEPLGYAFVDIRAVAEPLAAAIARVGRRRVVLFGWQDEQATGVRPTVVAVVTTTASAATTSADLLVARATFEIPATLRDATPLHALFRGALDPLVVAIDGSNSADESWRVAATHAGAAWLAFDGLVAREIARERDPLGAFTQWQRTHAALAPSLVLDALRRAIADPAPLGFAAAAHKFVLVGFPWRSLDARALDHSVGRVACVVVSSDGTSKDVDADAWHRVFEARGAVVRCVDRVAVGEALARVLAPHVTLVMGADVSPRATEALRLAAAWLGDVWMNVEATATATDATFQQLFRRVRRAHRIVLCGFPRSSEQAAALVRDVGAPRAVLVVGPVTAELESTLAFLQREAPHAVQSAVAPAAPATATPLHLRLLLATRVVVAVGDTAAVDTEALRPQLAAFGATVVDLRGRAATESPQDVDDVVHTSLDAVAGAAALAPRCLLLLRGAPSAPVVRALHTRLGDALAQLVVLKQRQAVPPRSPDQEGDDAYDSEEERERERVRLRAAAALSPALTGLVDALQKTVRVRVESFLRAPQAERELVDALRPAVLGVRGHALTFYREAARAACRTLHVPFVDLREHGANGTTVPQRLCGVVAATAAPVVVVDGFPVEADEPHVAYAAQQLRTLERVAAAPLFVRFRASVDVLLEKAAAPRLALEDAQDATTSAAAQDVDAAFAKRALLRDVSCEREPADAQDAFADALRVALAAS